MTRRLPLCLGLGLAAALAVQPITLRAQSPAVELRDRASISVFRFWTFEGPDDDLVAALAREQFGDTIPPAGSFGGGVSPAVPTPVSSLDPEPAWAVAVGLRLTEHLDLELGGNGAVPVAEVLGFNLPTGALLRLHTTVQAWSATTGLRLGPVRVAVGPAYYRTRVRTEAYWRFTGPVDEYIAPQRDEDGGFGALLAAGLVVPVWNRVLVQARGEYRRVGEREVGPFEAVGWAGESAPFHPQRIGFDHHVVMVGVGLRP